jgi:hypothetical protein
MQARRAADDDQPQFPLAAARQHRVISAPEGQSDGKYKEAAATAGSRAGRLGLLAF